MKLSILLGHGRPYRWSLCLAGGLMLCESAVTLALPWVGGKFVAGVVTSTRIDVGEIVAVLLGLFAAQALFRFSTAYVLGRTSERLLAGLRARVYDHLISLPLVVTGGGAVVLMFHLEPRLAVLVAVLVPAFYLLLKVTGRRLRPLSERLRQARATGIAIAQDSLTMLPVVKSFNREDFERRRYAAQLDEAMRLGTTVQRLYAGLGPMTQFLVAGAVLMLLSLASERVGSGAMPPAELVSFLLYAALLTRPVAALSGVYGQVQLARGQLRRLQEVLEQQPERREEGRVLGPVRGEIVFEGVRFAHPGRLATLEGVDLAIGAGETLALTGENGAGKTTLMHLLLRFFEPDAGRILIDGIDIATVSPASLRERIGLVPQNVLLMHGSVRENIAYGAPDATQDEIERAARLAQAHGFIAALPEGYETQIGDQGVRLSGGQRHRLALARALLKAPPVLILDEVTAMFDPEGERSFVGDARAAFADRTVILITHRPASLALADRIVTLERGRVVESRADQKGDGAGGGMRERVRL